MLSLQALQQQQQFQQLFHRHSSRHLQPPQDRLRHHSDVLVVRRQDTGQWTTALDLEGAVHAHASHAACYSF
jgi:hypothetical protein